MISNRTTYILIGISILTLIALAVLRCTFRIEPVVEINEASVNIGPIIVQLPDGGCSLFDAH